MVRRAAARLQAHAAHQPLGQLGRVLERRPRRDAPQTKGASVQFGDGQTVFRAPAPHVGGFDLPPALMDEMFVGAKHLHRLHQLELIQAAQGEWQDVPVHALGEGCAATGADGKPVALAVARYGGKAYLRDGDGSDAAGTIRMSWRVAKPQLFTVLAEAVKPGRAYTGTWHGSDGFTVSDPEAVVHALHGRTPRARRGARAAHAAGVGAGPKAAAPEGRALGRHAAPRLRALLCCETFLGRLWLFAPGELSTKELFAMAIKAENRCTCHVRVATMLLLYVGWLYLFSPLTETLRWIPFGDLVSYAVFFVVRARVDVLGEHHGARVARRPPGRGHAHAQLRCGASARFSPRTTRANSATSRPF